MQQAGYCTHTVTATLHMQVKSQTVKVKEAGCPQSGVSKHINGKLNGRNHFHKNDV